jgi:hypothetical protein
MLLQRPYAESSRCGLRFCNIFWPNFYFQPVPAEECVARSAGLSMPFVVGIAMPSPASAGHRAYYDDVNPGRFRTDSANAQVITS